MLYSRSSLEAIHFNPYFILFYFILFYFILFYLCLVFGLFGAAPVARGSSQARVLIGAVAASLYHSRSNSGSLTYWVRPGIELTSLWILVGFVNRWAMKRNSKTLLHSWFTMLCQFPYSKVTQSHTCIHSLFVFFFFLQPHPQHMEVPRLGVRS